VQTALLLLPRVQGGGAGAQVRLLVGVTLPAAAVRGGACAAHPPTRPAPRAPRLTSGCTGEVKMVVTLSSSSMLMGTEKSSSASMAAEPRGDTPSSRCGRPPQRGPPKRAGGDRARDLTAQSPDGGSRASLEQPAIAACRPTGRARRAAHGRRVCVACNFAGRRADASDAASRGILTVWRVVAQTAPHARSLFSLP
jgi:hypothetical protein